MEMNLPQEALTPQQNYEPDNIQNPETEGEKMPETASKQDIINQLREISLTDCADINAETIARLKLQFYNIHNEEIKPLRQQYIEQNGDDEGFTTPVDADEETLKQLITTIKEKKAQHRAEIETQQLRNYELKKDIIDQLNKIADDTDTVNLHYQKVKELQTQFKEIGQVPPQNTTEIWKAYQDANERFYDQWKVNKELRDYDFKKNLVEKQLLLDEAIRLNQHDDIIFAFRRLQELHDKWREIGPVAKDVREELWNNFKNASADINKRYQQHFELRKAQEKQNEEDKKLIIQQLQQLDYTTLKTYKQWDEMTQSILQLQEDWKKIGFASRKTNNTLFAQFREICDNFFAAKTAFYKQMKNELAENLEKKTQLCIKAEELAQSDDWKKTTDRIISLQKQWKTIGAVPKKHSDQIWKRFITACDTFFDRKKQHIGGAKQEEQQNLKTKQDIIQRLTQIAELQPDNDNLTAITEEIHALRAKWQQTGHVPFKEKDRLQEQYRDLVSQLFDKFNLKGNNNDIDPEKLARIYEQKLSEIKTYENNLGFLNATSKNGNSIIKDLETKIQRLRNELEQIAKKIKLAQQQ